MSCGVGRRCSLDPALLWLWCRPAATAPIRPLAWEPPYAMKRQQTNKQTNKKQQKNNFVKQNMGKITLFGVIEEDVKNEEVLQLGFECE